jgi:PAS domain S-box-containing protein
VESSTVGDEAAAIAGSDLVVVLDAMPNAVVGVDGSGAVVYANPSVASTFGYPPPDIIGAPIERLLPERLAGLHEKQRDAFLAGGSARPMGIGMELIGRRKNGTEFPAEISLAPLTGPHGPVVFATVVDLTQRAAIEARLLRAEKLETVGRLAGGIAHDFNNMLFAIRGYTELLEDDLAATGTPDVGQLMASVAAIRDATDRATSLTSQLLSFGRRSPGAPRLIHLSAAVGALEPMLKPLAGPKVHIDMELQELPLPVRIDPSRLDQILVNLAVNARDAMPDGGTLRISTRRRVIGRRAAQRLGLNAGPHAVLAVADTGAGIGAEALPHIFEPFFTTKEPGEGTGLGLFTTYTSVQSAGGAIEVRATGSHGSTFEISLPEASESPPVQELLTAAPERESRGPIREQVHTTEST